MSAIPNWVPLVISLISLMASGAFGYLAVRDRRQAFRISREREIYSWAVETLALYPDLRSDKPERLTSGLVKLSVQIDVGRLLFPNDRNTDFGKDKHPINQGFRSKVLDPLVTMYEAYSAELIDAKLGEQSKKDFIFEVSQHFPPVKTNTSPEFLTGWYDATRKIR